MFFTDDDIRRIKDASTGHLLNVVQDFQNLRKSGTSYVCDCPHCKASKKFSVNPDAKNARSWRPTNKGFSRGKISPLSVKRPRTALKRNFDLKFFNFPYMQHLSPQKSSRS